MPVSVRESGWKNQNEIPMAHLNPNLILASTSVYRRELLERLRLPFQVVAPRVDETPHPGEDPKALAIRLAIAKAQAVANEHLESVVIGSDQVANLKGECLGKPGTHEKAFVQLQRLRGQEVFFETAVAVICKNTNFQAQELIRIRVQFRELEDAEIENYLQAENPYDCAGSAKSEGLGISLLDVIESNDPTALIGLPLIATSRMLRQAGLRIF